MNTVTPVALRAENAATGTGGDRHSHAVALGRRRPRNTTGTHGDDRQSGIFGHCRVTGITIRLAQNRVVNRWRARRWRGVRYPGTMTAVPVALLTPSAAGTHHDTRPIHIAVSIPYPDIAPGLRANADRRLRFPRRSESTILAAYALMAALVLRRCHGLPANAHHGGGAPLQSSVGLLVSPSRGSHRRCQVALLCSPIW